MGKMKKLDIWLFYAFLMTFTLSIRKVLAFYPINGQFNDYTGIYIYLSDIFLLLTIPLWAFIILKNKYSILSIFKTLQKPIVYIPLFLIFLSFISTLWSLNKSLTFFRSIKILEFYLLYLYIIYRFYPYLRTLEIFHSNQNVPRGTFELSGLEQLVLKTDRLRYFLKFIIYIGLFQSIIGILQFLVQHSLGLFWLKESLIATNISGVAKEVFAGQAFIRAYGLFPHPNIFGGFLLFSIILTQLYIKLFNPGQKVPRGTNSDATMEQPGVNQNMENCSTPAPLQKFVPHGTSFSRLGWNNLIFRFALPLEFCALILTFSKSAIIALILAFLYIRVSNVPRGTYKLNNLKKLFHVEQLWKKLFLVILIILTFIVIAKPNMTSFVTKSITDRLTLLNVSRGTIEGNILVGVGMGQFVINMPKYAIPTLTNWQFQPVHNIFLLIWSELGLLGLVIIIWFFWKLFHVEHSSDKSDKIVPRGTFVLASIAKGILIGFIFIMLFDHYLWDIQQGELMLWMVMGFVAGESIT